MLAIDIYVRMRNGNHENCLYGYFKCNSVIVKILKLMLFDLLLIRLRVRIYYI